MGRTGRKDATIVSRAPVSDKLMLFVLKCISMILCLQLLATAFANW